MPTPPIAPKSSVTHTQLGRSRTDDYGWMKDENWQAVLRDPAVLRSDIRAHLQAENAYTAALLGPTEALQATLFEEMKGRIKEDDASVPTPDGPWDYYWRYASGAQHPIHARRPRGQESGEEILLDEEAEAEGKPYYAVAAAGHSPDHSLFAYAADEQGSEVYRLMVKDLASGQMLAGPAESTTGNFCFSPDSRFIFWTWRDENGRPAKIYRRPARGTDSDDVLIYEELDPGLFLGVGVTASDGFVVISAGNQETSEAWLIDAATPTMAPRLVAPRRTGVRYEIEHWPALHNRLIIRTNQDEAVDFKLMTADPSAPDQWRDWVDHVPGRLIEGMTAFAGHFVRLERSDALPRIVVTAIGGEEHAIAFAEEAFALDMDGGLEFDTTTLRFVYSSPTTPRQWFDYDLQTRERVLRKTQDIPSGHDPADYVTRRLDAIASDGERIPIFVLARRDTALDGTAPLLLYGYGSYGAAMEADFSIRRLSLVDRGWVWAIACIRGGSEKGRAWFLGGRRETKTNTFTDFIACAEHLIAERVASPDRIVAYGGSAGGMLMGAVANLRPELWAGVIAAVPFVDVLNTMSDASLPLTPPEWPEWGDPLTDPVAYDRIASYSPYDQVADRAYPAVLATGGLSDPRVTYWEPAKWVARLRDHQQGPAPILLKINMEAGHGGASGRFDFLKEIALDYAFAIWADARGWQS